MRMCRRLLNESGGAGYSDSFKYGYTLLEIKRAGK